MPTPLKNLTPRHRQAIRLLVLGMSLPDAAELIGLSPHRLCAIYRSDLGQRFALELERMANDYTARMLALGLTPRHIAAAAGGGKRPEQCKPPRRPRKPRSAPAEGNDAEHGPTQTDGAGET